MREYEVRKVCRTGAVAVVDAAVDVSDVAYWRRRRTSLRPRLLLWHISAGRGGGGYQVVAIRAIVIFVAFIVEFGQ